MIHIDNCVLCGQDKHCVRVEHIGPVCIEDINHLARATEYEEGSTG